MKNIGIIGAMEEEVSALIKHYGCSEKVKFLDFEFNILNYKDKKIVVVVSGIGKVKYLLNKMEEIAKSKDIKYFVGRIVSGDEFVSTNTKKQWLKENFDAMCTDMESASIAHVCFLNKIPFMAIRCISDTADDRAEMAYNEFEKIALEKCFMISNALIEEL